MKMKKMCIFGSNPNFIGGGETVESYLIEKLIENGVDVTVLSPQISDKISDDANLNNSINNKHKTIPIKFRKYPTLLGSISYAYSAKKMYDHIKHENFDLLLGFGPLSLAPMLITSRKSNDKYAVYLHAVISDEIISNINYKNIFSLINKLLSLIPMSLIEYFYLKKAELVFVNSQYTANKVFNAYRINKAKLSVAYGGVDTSFFNEKKEDKIRTKYNIKSSPMLLFVGRLAVKRKGLQYLLRAMPLIKQKIHDVKLVVVGDGPLRKKFERQTHAMKLDEDVIFIGSVDKKDLPYYYSSADIFVLPSTQEGLGLVILEALACKTPVIASNVGGVPEIITNDYNGIIIPSRNIHKIADETINLIQNKKKAEQLAKNGYEFVKKKYEWNVLLDEMLIKIDSLLT